MAHLASAAVAARRQDNCVVSSSNLIAPQICRHCCDIVLFVSTQLPGRSSPQLQGWACVSAPAETCNEHLTCTRGAGLQASFGRVSLPGITAAVTAVANNRHFCFETLNFSNFKRLRRGAATLGNFPQVGLFVLLACHAMPSFPKLAIDGFILKHLF